MKAKAIYKLTSKIFAVFVVMFQIHAAAQITGPNSSQSPYLIPVYPGTAFTSILTATDAVNGYNLSGIPDGLGVLDNGDGTFTLLMNHELGNTAGVIRAHGSVGSFVSKWIINKQDLSVISGSDLMQNVYLYDASTSTYQLANAANPSSSAAFNRFCSGDLPAETAFYNSNTGKGTPERIYMNGEEVTDGRAMAHIITGANTGTSWQLAWLGKLPWENAVANATIQDKTIVACLDDGSTTTSNLYFYIGEKTDNGNEIERAGLTNGMMYAVKVDGYVQERVNSTTINPPPAPGTRFQLVNIGSVLGLSGAQVEANSVSAGCTYFARVEDGTWNPSDLSQFYFQTTDQYDQVSDGAGTQVGRSRLWRLHFDDITNPELGGTIEAVLDGTEGQNMLDNLTMDNAGNLVLVEDVGNNAHNGKVWNYNSSTDQLNQLAKHDPARFGDIGLAATAPYTQDEESSGIIDVQSLLGPGMFLLDDQAHYTSGIPAYAIEGGQLLAMYNPLSADCQSYSATVNPGGNIALCRGEQAELKTNGGYGLTYQWYRNNAQIVGATNAAYATLQNGSFYVKVSNGTCTWQSSSTQISRLSTPTAGINVAGGISDVCVTGSVTLKATGGSSSSSYNWIKDGLAIAGVTSKKIQVSEPGNYSVTITNTSGCSSSAGPVSVTKSCRVEILNNQSEALSLSLYPNPASDRFTIELQTERSSDSPVTIQVVNLLGKVVFEKTAAVENGFVNEEMNPGSNLPAGTYFIRVIAGNNVVVKQIVYQP